MKKENILWIVLTVITAVSLYLVLYTAGVMKLHEPAATELKYILDNDPELKAQLERSIKMAALDNPDEKTNPVRNLNDLYDYIDYTLSELPWDTVLNYVDGRKSGNTKSFSNFSANMDQGMLYLYYLLDFPLQELENKGLFYNSVQYTKPISDWLVHYNNAWRNYLDSSASWDESYFNLLASEPQWNMTRGWYENHYNWNSFNDFFSRKLISPDKRPVVSPGDDTFVVSPADSVPQGVWDISDTGTFVTDPVKDDEGVLIKTSFFSSVEQVLGAEGVEYADAFNGGKMTHTLLSYEDYHRFHSPVTGLITAKYSIPRMDAAGGIVKWDNEARMYRLCGSDGISWQMYESRSCIIIDTMARGLAAVIPVGMGHVSGVEFLEKIKVGRWIERGSELGTFLFGGSDVMILFSEKADFRLTAGSIGGKYLHILAGEEYGRIE